MSIRVLVCKIDDTKPKINAEGYYNFKIINIKRTDQKELYNILTSYRPDVIYCVCPTDNLYDFRFLLSASFEIRKKCLGVKSDDEINTGSIDFCFMTSAMNHPGKQFNPLISVMTSTYKSGDKILRPFNALRAQTYTNWEWVIYDDSDDNNETWNLLKKLKEQDYRIRIYRSDYNDGSIGAAKYNSSMLSHGDYILELDHDDSPVENLFEMVVNAFKAYPETGFVYSDSCELEWGTETNVAYGDYFAFGYGSTEHIKYKGKWRQCVDSPPLNEKTLRYIVGVPNHVRVWKASLYRELNGHNPNFQVADDYELLVRTFLKTRPVRIAELGYLQYRNQGGDNFTNHRNALIQKYTRMISKYYDESIHNRLVELKMPDTVFGKGMYPNAQWWLNIDPNPSPRFEYIYKPNLVVDGEDLVSIVMPTYNRAQYLKNAIKSVQKQTYKNWELYIVGDKCPVLEDVMNAMVNDCDSRIRWWNLSENHGAGGAVPRNYALKMLIKGKYVAYLDDDNEWEPNHLETLMKCIKGTLKPQFPIKKDIHNEIKQETNIKFKKMTIEEEVKNVDISDEEDDTIKDKKTEKKEFINAKEKECNDIMYVFSSFSINGKIIYSKEPRKFRVDTSCVLHRAELLNKYGYWKDRVQGGYAHDWEFVSRWKDEKWSCTMLPTLKYCVATNQQSYEWLYNAVNDQKEHGN